jgi:hypothetical protein
MLGEAMRSLWIMLAVTVSGCTGFGSVPNPDQPAAVHMETPAPIASTACVSSPTGSAYKEARLRDVANILRVGDYKKGEFESSDEFRKRFSARLGQIEKQAGGNELYFSIPLERDKFKYDADSGLMKIGDDYLGIFWSMSNGLPVSVSRHSTGTYIGTNSFGVKKEIVKVDEVRLEANVPGGEFSSWPSSFKSFEIPLSKQEAKNALGNLAILFVGRLKPPYYDSGTTHFTPKIDAPYDITTSRETIYFDVDCAALYYRSNGKVLRLIDLTKT